jgi:hypothetical protein
MPTIVKRVSNACAQGTRWHATPNARRRKDQTIKISQNKEETTSQGWLIFTAVNWLSFIALQTRGSPQLSVLRLMPKEEMREVKVEGFMRSSSAAPPGTETLPLACFKAFSPKK